VPVVVARDSLEESHQGVGSRRPAHGAEPLPETLRLVSSNVAEYRARRHVARRGEADQGHPAQVQMHQQAIEIIGVAR
jgi:hypothetical protein